MVQKAQTGETRKRGRPRAFDPAVAIHAAAERFRTQGFAATTLDDLVDATGLARPSLYAAFGDKKAMYLAALTEATERIQTTLHELATADLPLREAVMRVLAHTIEGFLKGEAGPAGCIVTGTAAAEAVRDPMIRTALARLVAIEDAYIAAILAAGGSPDPQAHARIVAAVIHSLSVRARAGASREDLLRIAVDCVELVA